MMARLGLAVALVLGLSLPGAADPDPPKPIDLPETPAEITIPTTWKPVAIPEVEGKPVAAYTSPAGAQVVLSRAPAGNPPAWIERTRTKYLDEVEAGVAAVTDGYQRKHRTIQKVNGVPSMDLELSRKVDGVREDVVMRFVFFRTYTLTLVAVGSKKDRPDIDAIAKSFGPPKGYVP